MTRREKRWLIIAICTVVMLAIGGFAAFMILQHTDQPKLEESTDGSDIELIDEFVIGMSSDDSNLVVPEFLGNPSQGAYGSNIYAQNPWDLKVFGPNLLIGSGDYDLNVGGVELYDYNLAAERFYSVGFLPDEQVTTFKEIGSGLIIPGTDSTAGSWDWGNWYYISNNGSLSSFGNLPKAAHCFDAVEYDNALWFGLGAVDAPSQIVVSRDGGQTFEFVPFRDNHGERTDPFRVYNLFESDGNLWALCENDVLYVYRKELGIFDYSYNTISLRCLYMGQVANNGGVPFSNIISFADNLLMINGKVLVTGGMEDFRLTESSILPMAENTEVFDALVKDGTLYLLAGTKTSEGWRVSVYSTEDLESWEEVLYFNSSNFARSFELYEDSFYFGLGSSVDEANVHCGEIWRCSL